ncbi:gustatory receptor for sugar taste 43a-like [Vespula maculifrons]|uniref:Gustatory receptor for sugar taste 43a-like n=1 Tax=Vespula maculifrons TaxID=7453 RepID=A0ABD2CNV5_VESMC
MKFVQLNAILQNMLTTTVYSPQHKRVLRMEDDSSFSTIYRTYKTNEDLVKLKKVKQIHLELIKCARIINGTYGLQILMSIFSSVICITTLSYNLYTILITNKNNDRLVFVINNICETTMTEKSIFNSFIFLYAMNTGDILYELYEPSTSSKFHDEIRNFTIQLLQNRLTFTACGFFDLDHSLIYSSIGLITTYLIILLQVGDKPRILLNNTNYNSTPMI